ncbi:S9 family peptidase [Novosphingobium ginsenosidimutans]|uniref:S9 family peptidase n=2 Tax=Novosphingobium ginsenosidimutans TaxID=1176536 RepID=A0A5B8S112_9SPHN|nr:S9 family peptidase [Novosphingobium ginsenosidimutans]
MAQRQTLAGLGLILALMASPVWGEAPSATRPAEAPPPKIPTLSLAKDSGIGTMKLSPDGTLIALRSTTKDSTSIAVLDAATKDVLHRLALPQRNNLEWFRWAGNGKLLFSLSTPTVYFGEEARLSRLFFYDLASKAMPFIGRPDMGLEGDDVLFVDPAGEYLLLAMQRTIYDYPSVWRFALTEKPIKGVKEVQRPTQGIWEWFADDAGIVRMGMAFAGGKVRVMYRAKPDDPLREIAKITEDNADDKVWDVLRITSGSDEGLVLKPDDNGRIAVRKFNYATRQVGEVIYAAPGWDVDEALTDKDGKLLAAFYTDDRDRAVWFEPKLKSLYARLEKAIPDQHVWIVSRAEDDSRMLVWAGNEANPGQTFMFDAAKRSLDSFSAELPDLDRSLTASPKPIRYTARDGTAINGYLTLPRGRSAKKLPLIVMPHGGPYGVRDKLEFDSTVQLLANRGYAVIQPNYRGSGGYGESFAELGAGQIGRAMQDDLDDAMDWAVKEGIADPARVCMVGASYGGYAALWAAIRNPERYRCAVSFAGVTDWKKQLKYDANFFTRKGAKSWRTRIQGEDANFDLDLVSPVAQIARLTRPVLVTHGEDDSNVPFKQFLLLRDAATKAGKPIETLTFAGEGHGFADDANEARYLDAIEAFLAKHNPAD